MRPRSSRHAPLARDRRRIAGPLHVRRPSRRRGISFEAVLWSLIAIAGLGTAAIVVTPRVLQAGAAGASWQPVKARSVEHQQLIDQLASLAGRSHRVLAVQQRGRVPLEEIALWVTDSENPGVIDPQEVAVISHSRNMQTLVFYELSGLDNSQRKELQPHLDVLIDERTSLFALWRQHPASTARVIGRDLSDVVFEILPCEPARGAARSVLRIALTWAAESADGSDTASALVDVHCASIAQEKSR